MFHQNGKKHLLCSTVSNFRRMKSLNIFGIRCPILSHYILQTVSVLGFHSPYHFMMASKVKGWQYSPMWGLAFMCGISCSLYEPSLMGADDCVML
jgi:hypothetical protein